MALAGNPAKGRLGERRTPAPPAAGHSPCARPAAPGRTAAALRALPPLLKGGGPPRIGGGIPRRHFRHPFVGRDGPGAPSPIPRNTPITTRPPAPGTGGSCPPMHLFSRTISNAPTSIEHNAPAQHPRPPQSVQQPMQHPPLFFPVFHCFFPQNHLFFPPAEGAKIQLSSQKSTVPCGAQ